MSETKRNIHTGHRERMREKLENHGARVFQTYELLEMLLYYVLPYKNTNPTAKELMLRFGDVDSLFKASKSELCEVEGVGGKIAELLSGLGDFSESLFSLSERHVDNPFLNYKTTGKFLTEYFSTVEDCKVSLALFNNRMERILISDLYSIDYSSAKVRADVFVDLAVSTRASVAIIAHNHPFGPLYPTVGDIETNKMIEDALNGVGVSLLEHYIISGDAYVGFMNHLHTAFSQTPEIEGFLSSKDV